jgi:hypothetical protein
VLDTNTHLIRPGQSHDPSSDVERDPADVAVAELDLAGVYGRPDLKAERTYLWSAPPSAAIPAWLGCHSR